MNRKFLLEISVETSAAAVAAECGGADRIELCADLSAGGVTPTAELLRSVRQQVRIPVFSMIRPRGRDFVYSEREFERMKKEIGIAKKSGMDGVVFGILKPDRSIDVERTRQLVATAQPLPVTFHRAFDESAVLRLALEDVIRAGAARILSSGGAVSAPAGAPILAELVAAADDRIVIMPGAGINASNVARIAKRTGAVEFHSALGSILRYGSNISEKFESEVRRLVEQLAGLQ